MEMTASQRAGRDDGVCVIIPAFNARDTVGAAVASALAEPQTAEVVVVDDASSDGTAEAARGADDGSERLRVIAFAANRGPSAARNAAIAASGAPFVAVLDADDRFLPGRLGALLSVADWDLIADDIVFTAAPDDVERLAARAAVAAPARSLDLSLEAFVAGNMTRAGRRRRELGFLHPVMRRAFLEEHALSYDEALRLGEDYDLYARALLCGARYKLVGTVGYLALERPGSLSGSHRTDDLARLCAVDTRLLRDPRLTPREASAIRAHRADVSRRHRLRAFLDIKRAGGSAAGALHLLRNASHVPSVVAGVSRDKLRALLKQNPTLARDRRPRTLFHPQLFDGAQPRAAASRQSGT